MHSNVLNENQRIKEMLIEKDSTLANLGYERHQLQDRLINDTGAARVESIRASHSAYFSKPDELVKTILALAG